METSGERVTASKANIRIPTARENLELVQLRLEDAAALFALIDANRDHLSQHEDKTADKYPTELAMEESIVSPKNPDKLRFGIWDGRVLVGSINLTPKGVEAEIGYWLATEHVGMGYATDSTKALVQYAFDTLGYRKLFAKTDTANVASGKTLERAGFVRTREEDSNFYYTIEKKS